MAIEINGVKHACASCIRGHRVKKCNHTEREMVPIPKRGRQISQCTHCRNLRKSNRTHVKCTCAITKSPNPLNGCLCEVVHNCSCVAHHLQDTSNPPEINTLPVTPPDTTSSSLSSNSPVSLYDVFDLASPSPLGSLPTEAVSSSFGSVPSATLSLPIGSVPPILSSSPSLSTSSCCSSQYSNNNNFNYNMTTNPMTTNPGNNMLTTMMMSQDTSLMSLSISELLDLPLQFTINNDVDLSSALQMQNSF